MRPMLATPGPLPTAPGWAYEVKWDGIRLLVSLGEDGPVRLYSRNGTDHTTRWPQLHGIADATPSGTLLDGELVALDAAGRPSFGVLMASQTTGGRAQSRPRTPVTLLAFDVLRCDGHDVTGRPWHERRGLLESFALDGPAWRTPEVFDDGATLLEVTATDGLEGVVAKRRTSPYRPGVRSPDWVKVAHRRATSVVVGGWQPGGTAGLKSLVVGTPQAGGALLHLGSVGSGISVREASALLAVLGDIAAASSPFTATPVLPDVRWVEPLLVVDVEHLGHTEGALLRQAVFVRARPDLSPQDLSDGGAA